MSNKERELLLAVARTVALLMRAMVVGGFTTEKCMKQTNELDRKISDVEKHYET